MSERFHEVEALFHRARGLPAADRGHFLDGACAGDLELRGEVEALLLHADGETAAVAMPTLVDRGPLAEGPGSRIGPYRLLQQIGEGGFGVVYMARQEEPVRRQVAIKVIKLGMDTKQVIARFEAERQALALMDHPNIARVLDAGATDTGRPYFVMELVRGITITEYCDQAKLTAPARLELFIKVCSAIQHAHQKGIIHRDLKPSNVLVTLHDDVPVPKVIDFGIAKATSQRLTERTLFTEFRQFVGTPEYMSPDQAEISGLDVDTRSDIYSLGVLLYELLTGTTPFDSETLRRGGYAEIQRIIREVEPPMPSTRVTSLQRVAAPPTQNGAAEAPPDGSTEGTSVQWIAQHRRVEPAALGRLLRGDLDWIVMKAMEKDRTRRYQTAMDLAADIERHLRNEPVEAGAPGVGYRLGKFVRRNRTLVISGSLVAAGLALLLTAVGFSTVRALREGEQNRQVREFLQSLIMNIDADEGSVGLDEVIARGRRLFGDDHAVMGTLLGTRAAALRTAGRLDDAVAAREEAVAFMRTAHGADHPAVAAELAALAALHDDRGEQSEAEAALRQALAIREQAYGRDSELTADTLRRLVMLLVTSGDQARHEEIRTRWAETVERYDLALGQRHRTSVIQLCSFATWLHNNGYDDEAEPLLPEAVSRARDVLPADDLTRFLTLNAWAQVLLHGRGDYESVLPILEEMLASADRVWGPGHVATLSLRIQLPMVYQRLGRPESAGRALEAFIDAREASDARGNIIMVAMTEQAMVSLSDWLSQRPELGHRLMKLFVADGRAAFGVDSASLSKVLWASARWQERHGFYAEALANLEERLPLARVQDERRVVAQTLASMGTALNRLDRPAEAEARFDESIEIGGVELADDDWRLASALRGRASARVELGRYAEAEADLLAAWARVDAADDAPGDEIAETRAVLAAFYEDRGRPDDAATWTGTP